jgi:regulatory protein
MPGNELFKSALNKAMALCAGREFSAGEILSRLRLWGLDENEGLAIIGLLEKDNFINEERYAIAFARDKFKYNKWGKIKITAQLRAKGIPGETIKKALDTIDNEIYKLTLSNLLSVHSRSVKAKNEYDLKAKLLRYGLSKGFESSLLYELLNEMDE